jgi:hypothetical protein
MFFVIYNKFVLFETSSFHEVIFYFLNTLDNFIDFSKYNNCSVSNINSNNFYIGVGTVRTYHMFEDKIYLDINTRKMVSMYNENINISKNIEDKINETINNLKLNTNRNPVTSVPIILNNNNVTNTHKNVNNVQDFSKNISYKIEQPKLEKKQEDSKELEKELGEIIELNKNINDVLKSSENTDNLDLVDIDNDPDKIFKLLEDLEKKKEMQIDNYIFLKTEHDKKFNEYSDKVSELNLEKRDKKQYKNWLEIKKKEYYGSKDTYCKIKDKMKEEEIPIIFRDKYPILKFMENNSLLDNEHEFEIFMELYYRLCETNTFDDHKYVSHDFDFCDIDKQEAILEFIQNSNKYYPKIDELLDANVHGIFKCD